MKSSLIIHLTDLSNGWQLNGEGQMTGGELAQGSITQGVIVRETIGIRGNCPGGNFPGEIVWEAVGIGGNSPGGIVLGAISTGGGGGNCPVGNCPVTINFATRILSIETMYKFRTSKY